MIYELIDVEKATYPIAILCRTLGVARSAWYDWKSERESRRAAEDRRLKVHIRAAHRSSRGTYGAPRIQQYLANEGLHIGRRRVARLMREEGLAGTPAKRFKNTTDSNHNQPIAKNHLARAFKPSRPNQVQVTDITYIHTHGGFLYLVVFIDLYSKKVVGWAAETHMKTALCMTALKQAIVLRGPEPGLIIHSDRGCQYASHGFSGFLESHGFKQSMSRKGNCWDNAPAESFFGTLKTECTHRKPWPSPAAAKDAISDTIHNFYNNSRLHSANGYQSPVDYEHNQKQQQANMAA